jgi:branched-chain amino acid transport system permease protein
VTAEAIVTQETPITSEPPNESNRPARLLSRGLKALEHPDVRFGMWTFVGTMLVLIWVGFLFPTPPSMVFLGATLGALNALVAMGIVLIYRANRIINFAQGDLGAIAAVLAISLIVGPGWNFFLALGAGLLAALAIGAIVEFAIIRRFAKSPRLILTVATIGLSSILAGGQLLLPRAFGYTTAPQNFQLPINIRLEWFPYTYHFGHVMVFIAVPAVALGLAAFFRFTRVGIAVRAAAESADRASLLGVPVKRVGTLVWVIASGLSAVAILIKAPIVGVPIGSVLGPSILLRALTAAVIARMEKLGTAFMVALLLGVIEIATFWKTQRTLLADVVLFGVIMAALLLQRRGAVARAVDAGVSTWQSVKEIRPIPQELRKVTSIRWFNATGALVLVFALVIWPLWWNGSRVNLVGVGLVFAMIGVSLVVLTGWAGQISLGHLAFVAFGGAVAGKLSQAGWHFVPSLIAAGLVGAFVAVLIGLPALRIRGPFLAVSTLGFALATASFFLNREFFPWLVPSGRVTRPTDLFGKFDLESEHAYYYVLLLGLGLMVASARSLRRSRTGRTLIAVRDNSRAAQSYGVSPMRAQLTAFAISGFYAAFAGGLYVFHQHGLSETILQPEQSIRVFQMVVIGGLGSIPGGLIGAAWETFLRYSPATRLPLTQFLASGVGTLVILLFLPGGLGGAFYELRDTVLRKIAQRKGIHVPSLVADKRIVDGADESDQIAEERAILAANREGMDESVEDRELIEV